MTLQILAEQIRLLFHAAWPGVVYGAVVVGTWALSRFVARYQQQRDILSHLPQVIRDEMQRRDAELKSLRSELAAASESVAQYRVRLRAAAVMAGKVGELLLPTPEETEPLQLVARRK